MQRQEYAGFCPLIAPTCISAAADAARPTRHPRPQSHTTSPRCSRMANGWILECSPIS